MRFRDCLARLETAGTAQNRKVYARHGVSEPLFGVSYAELRRLAKEAGTDPALAERLWATGNHDARVLATMIADPARCGSRDLDRWVRDLDSYVLTDAFAALAGQTRFARSKADNWTRSSSEFIGQAGWNLVAHLAMQDSELDDAHFIERLRAIESGVHDRPNRIRHAMNGALIAIGIRNEALRDEALEAAARIGKVEVDHGETSCKTPDAAEYIARTLARRSDRRKKRRR